MNILNHAYLQFVSNNERNLRFWKDYVNNLKSLDFSIFSEKLTVPALVPIGNRIFFRGELKHTNEVTVALGADYFVKCSLKQAEVLRQHRLQDAQSKLDIYTKEKEYLVQQLSFSKENVYENLGKEIVEVYSEEEERMWKEQHKNNMKRYKMQSKADPEATVPEITDEELWNRLEELELQEELENELADINITEPNSQKHAVNTFIVKEPDVPVKAEKDIPKKDSQEIKPPPQTPKLDLLQQVLEKQTELEQKLFELKNKERSQTKTEQELIDRLDEIEKLEELEDEMDRLEDILETEDVESTDEEDSVSRSSSTTKRGVTFADEDESETLEIVFKHSTVEPSHEIYNPEKGIKKPSDIYDAYSNLFTETTSILKKTKYECSKNEDYVKNTVSKEKNNMKDVEVMESDNNVINKTIVVKDVIEKIDVKDNKVENNERPTSLFKKKRLQKQ